jgi:hypothetical protein
VSKLCTHCECWFPLMKELTALRKENGPHKAMVKPSIWQKLDLFFTPKQKVYDTESDRFIEIKVRNNGEIWVVGEGKTERGGR